MTKALDDIELHVAMALVQISNRVKKAYGSGNWKKEEDAILIISKLIGEHIRTHVESVETQQKSMPIPALRIMKSANEP